MGTPRDAIRLDKLTKRYSNGFKALDEASFNIAKGDVVGYLGPNGSGKTTTIKVLTNILKPTSGHAYVCGIDVNEDPTEALQRIGALIEVPGIYDYLTPHEILSYFGKIRGMPRGKLKERITEVLKQVKLTEWEHKKTGQFSTGMQRRLGIANAILHEPEILILDEPVIGLDPRGMKDVRDLIRHLQERGITIFLSSHLLQEVSEICNQVIFLDKGKVVTIDSVQNIIRREAVSLIDIRFLHTPKPSDAGTIRNIDGVITAKLEDGYVTIKHDGAPETPTRILNSLMLKGFDVSAFCPHSTSLEDLYMSMMGDEKGVS